MLRPLTLTVVCATFAVAAHAQIPNLAAQQAEAMRWQAEMVKAQAASIRRGDEALSCEALQKELLLTMNDPAIQAYAEKANATVSKQLATRQKTGEMSAEYAAALAAALTPGMAMGGMPQMTPGQAINPQQIQEAMAAQQKMAMTYMQQMMPLMPALMRSQRVTQLAVVKNCAWATGGLGFYPNGVPPGAIPAIPAGVPQR